MIEPLGNDTIQNALWYAHAPITDRGAIIDGPYRYLLWRTWATSLPSICFVLLNPSVADHQIDDPTLRRCISFARREGAGSLSIVNLFALRATDPTELKRVVDPIGPDNDTHIWQAATGANQVILAWGTHGHLHERDKAVLALLHKGTTRPLLCLGYTASGAPRHPLYLKADTSLHIHDPQRATTKPA